MDEVLEHTAEWIYDNRVEMLMDDVALNQYETRFLKKL